MKCFKCQRRGHYARVCRNSGEGQQKSVCEVQEAANSEYFLGTVTQERTQDKTPWMITLSISNTPVRFKIDCGADVTVMTLKQYNALKQRPRLREDKSTLKGVGGILTSTGVFTATAPYKDELYKFDVHVVPESDNNLLSRSVSQMMGLIELKVGEVSEDVFGENCKQIQ